MHERWKKIFAVNTKVAPLTDDELALLDQLAYEITRRGMTVPALAFLEMSRPLGYLGSQAMQFFSPTINALFDARKYQLLARLLERRDVIDLLCRRIEAREAERNT